MVTTEANTELVDRVWEEAVENGDLAVIDEVLATDYVGHTPGAPEVISGREGFKRYVRTLRDAFSGLSVTIEERIVSEGVVVDRYRARGTHEGEFRGVPPTGAEIEFTGIVIHYIEDGQVVKDVSEFNALDLMEQLGVVEPPGE